MDAQNKNGRGTAAEDKVLQGDSATYSTKAGSCKKARELLDRWRETYPVFAEYKPLAIGIRDALITAHEDTDPRIVGLAIRFHVKTPRYLQALSESETRHNFDDSVAGEVTAEHREVAKAQLAVKLARDSRKAVKPKKCAKAWDSLKPAGKSPVEKAAPKIESGKDAALDRLARAVHGTRPTLSLKREGRS